MNGFDVIDLVHEKAKEMHAEQMARLAVFYNWATEPLSWEEIGIEARLAWCDAAAAELRVST